MLPPSARSNIQEDKRGMLYEDFYKSVAPVNYCKLQYTLQCITIFTIVVTQGDSFTFTIANRSLLHLWHFISL